MTWKEGGTAHTAQIATASIVRNSQLDYLQLGGGQASVAVAMGVAVNPPPLAAGSFVCGGTGYPIVSFSYTGSDGSNLTCTLDLTMVGLATGVHAVGTFSATFGVTGGGTKSVTDGRFDIPLIVTGP